MSDLSTAIFMNMEDLFKAMSFNERLNAKFMK